MKASKHVQLNSSQLNPHKPALTAVQTVGKWMMVVCLGLYGGIGVLMLVSAIDDYLALGNIKLGLLCLMALCYCLTPWAGMIAVAVQQAPSNEHNSLENAGLKNIRHGTHFYISWLLGLSFLGFLFLVARPQWLWADYLGAPIALAFSVGDFSLGQGWMLDGYALIIVLLLGRRFKLSVNTAA
ncbi:hypothetical protein EXU30_17325 [Shewanella maritima]|uniref:Transporter n=1 Tax=Shewanella maritima TaxID=2520507 RepID=A0A411PL35_9GAMM|nr:hypothetical protein [Shewanella maritima]QBF84235.1 hypothetical protein EXU30_17325 [Shewanella maritima]